LCNCPAFVLLAFLQKVVYSSRNAKDCDDTGSRFASISQTITVMWTGFYALHLKSHVFNLSNMKKYISYCKIPVLFFVLLCSSMKTDAQAFVDKKEATNDKVLVTPSQVRATDQHVLPPQAPAKCAFEALITRSLSGATSRLQFQAVSYNDGNAFSPASNEFVVPNNGLYFFSFNLLWNDFGCNWGAPASATVMIMKNDREAVQSYTGIAPGSASGGNFNTALSFSKKFMAGDRLSIHVIATLCDGGGTAANIRGGVFSGYRIYSE